MLDSDAPDKKETSKREIECYKDASTGLHTGHTSRERDGS